MGQAIRQYSRYLVPSPSFFSGIGRIFDFSGSLNVYNYSKNGTEADMKAAYLDWAAVGQDLRIVMEEHESRKTTKK